MESGPPISPAEQTPSTEKKESSKSKKKDAEKLGALVVESKPEARREREAKPERAANADSKENDKAPELDAEAPLEHLSEAERELVTQELAHERRAEVEAELEQLDSEAPEAVQALAADSFLARAEASGDPQAAMAETLAEYDAAVPETTEESSAPEVLPVAAVLEEVINTHEPAEGEFRLKAEQETVEDEAASSNSTPATPPTAAGGGGASPPPGGGGGRFGGGAMPPGGGFNPNAMPGGQPNQAPVPANVPLETARYYERQAEDRGLLLGGIVGYLIGRRRGRIRTEKRLLPVQKKLEKEVQGLRSQLAEQEAMVRQAVGTSGTRKPLERAARMEQRPARPVAPEANQLHGKPSPLEHIGQVLIAAEAVPEQRRPQPEKVAAVAAPEPRTIEKQVDTMTRAELLEASEKIIVDGANLRQVYETHLVGEKGLRRLVTEHLRGGDIKRALRRELVEREIDFERDPILRDRARSSLSSAGAGKQALNNLLEQAGAAPVEDADAAVIKARAAHDTKVAARQQRQRRVADVTMVTLIVILAVAIIVLVSRTQ